MDKSNESNSSSSWVFVYGNVSPNEKSNTFHLDCSREPIQELTEQDLSLPGSDIESEKGTDTSDGISIISESEIPFEENCATYSDCLKIDDIHETQIIENRIVCTNPLCLHPPVENNNTWDWKHLLTPFNLISAGVVVSAVLVALYSSLTVSDDATHEEPSAGMFQNIGVSNRFDEIVDKTISCACGNRKREAIEVNSIKRCVYNRLIEYSNINDEKNTMTEHMKDDNIHLDDISINEKIHMTKFKQKQHHKKINEKEEKKQHKHFIKQFSGEWYNNMHKNRAELRTNIVKDSKAQWYFNRATGRKHFRQKKYYRTYSD